MKVPIPMLLAFTTAICGMGDDLSDLIQAALDQPVQLELQDAPLPQAFARIADQTGVQIDASKDTLSLLPYGEETRVSVQMSNIPLREGMRQLTEPLGLRCEARERSLEVVPGDVLRRIGRRAKWEELDALNGLRSADFNADSAALDWLRSRLQFRLGAIDGWSPLAEAISHVGAGPGTDVLTAACDALGWSWTLEGEHIIIRSKPDQVAAQLDRTISLRETHRPLVDVLQSLGRLAGVPVRSDPGAIASLPAGTRSNFSLLLENKSVREALEAVAASTGLGYRIEADTVVFYHPGATIGEDASATQTKRDPFVGKIVLPAGDDGTTLEIFVHESDLSPEVNALRQKHLERVNDAFREALLKLESNHENDP